MKLDIMYAYHTSRCYPGTSADWGGVEVCSVKKTPGGPLPDAIVQHFGDVDASVIPAYFTLKVCMLTVNMYNYVKRFLYAVKAFCYNRDIQTWHF